MIRTKAVRGLVWPLDDTKCAAVVFDSVADLERVYSHCRGFNVAVQAGGNCGVWPLAMADRFATVYTFEPDPLNFYCLCRNAPNGNVVKFNAAIGFERGLIDLDRSERRNCGAFHIGGSGTIPTLRIDDLALKECDLIYLDIEGFEFAALHGAADTIIRCRPVVAIEEKGLSERYGVARGKAESWLQDALNYRVADHIGRDVILVPN